MGIARMKDIRAMSSEQRNEKLRELRTELVRLRTMVKAGGMVENSSRIRELRKTVARILTVDNEAKHGKRTEKK